MSFAEAGLDPGHLLDRFCPPGAALFGRPAPGVALACSDAGIPAIAGTVDAFAAWVGTAAVEKGTSATSSARRAQPGSSVGSAALGPTATVGCRASSHGLRPRLGGCDVERVRADLARLLMRPRPSPSSGSQREAEPDPARLRRSDRIALLVR